MVSDFLFLGQKRQGVDRGDRISQFRHVVSPIRRYIHQEASIAFLIHRLPG